MENMKSVLLVFDDTRELEFIEANLTESGYQVLTSYNLKEALTIAENNIPNLIVVNTFDSESSIQLFSQQIKTEELKNTSLLSLIELEDYLKASSVEHLVVKPVRPKLLLSLIRGLMNNEKINWLSSFH